jgi:hypothetical protein
VDEQRVQSIHGSASDCSHVAEVAVEPVLRHPQVSAGQSEVNPMKMFSFNTPNDMNLKFGKSEVKKDGRRIKCDCFMGESVSVLVFSLSKTENRFSDIKISSITDLIQLSESVLYPCDSYKQRNKGLFSYFSRITDRKTALPVHHPLQLPTTSPPQTDI